MKKTMLKVSAVIMLILAVSFLIADYNVNNGSDANTSKNNISSEHKRNIDVQDGNKTFLLSKDDAVSGQRIVMKNKTISLEGPSTAEKIIKLKDLEREVDSYDWLSFDEKTDIFTQINTEYLLLQQGDDYGKIPAELVIGNQVIKLRNAPDLYTAKIINTTLADFPSKDIAGIYEIDFNETPVDSRTGKHYPMYYWKGKITIRPGFDADSFTEFGDTFPQKLAHEIGHNIIEQGVINDVDLKRFAALHDNKRDDKNFLTKYAKEENAAEDLSESVGFWRGNTKLFCEISARNSVMQEKFLIVAKLFCHDFRCVIYVSSGNEPVASFTGAANIYRGLFWYGLHKEEIVVAELSFSEFKCN